MTSPHKPAYISLTELSYTEGSIVGLTILPESSAKLTVYRSGKGSAALILLREPSQGATTRQQP